MLHSSATPTIHPRYTVTDTGALRERLDVAARRWPEVTDRRVLLLRLAEAGREAIGDAVDAASREVLRDRQRAAMVRAADLVDPDALLADTAWR